MTENIFFTINSSKIRTEEEQKIEKLAEFMKNHADCKVTICGYADKQTGNADINERLSKNRAEAVATMLKKKVGDVIDLYLDVSRFSAFLFFISLLINVTNLFFISLGETSSSLNRI